LYSFIDEQGINYEELETTHVQNKSIVYKSTKGSREKNKSLSNDEDEDADENVFISKKNLVAKSYPNSAACTFYTSIIPTKATKRNYQSFLLNRYSKNFFQIYVKSLQAYFHLHKIIGILPVFKTVNDFKYGNIIVPNEDYLNIDCGMIESKDFYGFLIESELQPTSEKESTPIMFI